MNESMRKIIYYENILEFKDNTKSELHLEEVNNWQLCRTCLVEAKDGDWDLRKMCVMDAFEGRFLSAHDMLEKITRLSLNEGDILPHQLCKDCVKKITSLYFFSMQVHKAEEVLRNLSLKLRQRVENTDTPASNLSAPDIEEGQQSHINNKTYPETDEICEEKVVESSVSTSMTKTEDWLEELPVKKNELDVADKSKNEEISKEPSPSKEEDKQFHEESIKESDIQEPEVIKSNSPISSESEMEIVLMEDGEDFTEFVTDDFGFESCTENDEVSLDNENSEATEEILLIDGEEEYLEEKYHIDEEIDTNKEDDLEEIVIPNTLFLDEDLNIACAEPVSFTRIKRVRQTRRQTQSKHWQRRVVKPLLESKTCDICQEPFKLQRDLVAHVKEQHPNSKAYQCRECGQSFSYTQSLSRHMNTHKIELHKFQCDHCPKAFVRPDDLTRHIRTHTGERPYKCVKCDKAFKQQGEMKQHLTTHLERRSYECNQCYYVFTSRNSLYLHKKSNHTEAEDRKFKCLQCKKVFKSNQDLLEHKKKHRVVVNENKNGVQYKLVEE